MKSPSGPRNALRTGYRLTVLAAFWLCAAAVPAEQDRPTVGLVLGGSVYIGADSFVGPAYLALGFTEGGETAVYVFIGPSF